MRNSRRRLRGNSASGRASAAVLDGSIAQIGTQYLLTLKAVNCVSGESLASTEAQASDKNHVLDALGKTASEIRNKLGESLSTVQKFDTPLEEATTPSLEALKAFSSGRKELAGDDWAAAVRFSSEPSSSTQISPSPTPVRARYRNLDEPTSACRLHPEGLRTAQTGPVSRRSIFIAVSLR